MVDTNYISGVVKILENPRQVMTKKNNIPMTQFRAQLPQIRQTRIITLVFWGNLARDVVNYYKVNDYILIEGYISLRQGQKIETRSEMFKRIEITVLRIYPFLLNYNSKISNLN